MVDIGRPRRLKERGPRARSPADAGFFSALGRGELEFPPCPDRHRRAAGFGRDDFTGPFPKSGGLGLKWPGSAADDGGMDVRIGSKSASPVRLNDVAEGIASQVRRLQDEWLAKLAEHPER